MVAGVCAGAGGKGGGGIGAVEIGCLACYLTFHDRSESVRK